MKNYIQNGSTLTYEIPSATTIDAGDVVIIGQFVGVAVNGGTTGDKIAVNIAGVYKLTLKSSVNVDQGDKLYWDSTPGEITKTVTDVFIGTAFEDSLGSTGEVLVQLAGVSNGSAQAANVTFTAGTNLVGVDGSGSNAAPLVETEARLDALDTAVGSILTALKNAGLMLSS